MHFPIDSTVIRFNIQRNKIVKKFTTTQFSPEAITVIIFLCTFPKTHYFSSSPLTRFHTHTLSYMCMCLYRDIDIYTYIHIHMCIYIKANTHIHYLFSLTPMVAYYICFFIACFFQIL